VILRCTVQDPVAGREHDVEITAEPSSSVGSLLAALPIPVKGRPCYAGAERLDPHDALEDCPLVAGARLTIGVPGEPARAASSGVAGVLRVVGGPDAGRSYPIPHGDVTVGRSASADVVLTDPMVSRSHATLHVTPTGLRVTDNGSANGTEVGDVPVSVTAAVPPGTPLRLGDDVLEVLPSPGPALFTSRSPDGRLEFDRGYAPAPSIPRPEVTLPLAPSASSGLKAMIGAAAAPIVLGVVMAAMLRNPAMLLFAAFAPASAATSYLMERGQRRKRRRDFEAARADAEARIRRVVAEEERLRHELAPDPTAVLLLAEGATRGLWPRNLESAEGLLLRVGTADLPPSIDLRGDPWPGFEQPLLRSVPVTVDLRATGVLGIVGPAGETEQITNWLVAQLATLRSPDDLRLVVLAPNGAGELSWTRWLPHVDAGDAGDVPCWVGNTAETRAARIEELKRLISERREALQERASTRFDTEVVVVLQGALAGRKTPGMRELLREGFEVGVYTICVDERDMNECRGVCEIDREHMRVRRQRSDHPETARTERLSGSDAERLARALAPMRDRLTGRDDSGAIPYPLRFLDLLRIGRLTSDDVLATWKEHSGPTLRVPLGADARGQVDVDLAEQGPHTMLAGATGAGKSILLQTLVTSLLLANRPDELNLVLVDFKGGSAFLPFARCPHVVALIRSTDDDPSQKFDEAAAARVLTSIRAEVRYREAALARYGGEIDLYWAERERRPTLPPLPRLVMIFDEFARAIEVSPDFPKELVNVAAKGRSLGMHLVLATQSMQQKLSPEMKNNISLRVTLRQNERADSMEVLGVPDAVGIPGRLRGRGMILCTKDEVKIPRTFQSGYLGDPPPTGGAAPARLRIVEWASVGASRPKSDSTRTREATDQVLAIEAVEAAAEKLDLAAPRRPLLPPLPADLPLEDLPERATAPIPPTTLPFGLVDDPENQQQPAAVLDLAGTERLLVAGGPQSGRTGAVRALVTSLAERFRPEQAHVYVIGQKHDELASYTTLPHCGGVLSPLEPDRIRRLVGWLGSEVERRNRSRYSAGGVEDPSILLVVDSWECLENRGAGLFDETSVLTTLREIISTGPPVGVHVVAVGGQDMLTSRLPELYSRRVLLTFPDERTRRANLPQGWASPAPLVGRGIEASSGLHLQVTPPRRKGAELASRDPSSESGLPRRFPSLPTSMTVRELRLPDPVPSPTWTPIGVGGPDVDTVGLDLFESDPHLLLVSGSAGTGRSTAAATIVAGLRAADVAVLVVAPPKSPMHAWLSPDVPVLRATALSDADLRAAAAPLDSSRYAVVVDDVEQIKVTPSNVNFLDQPTLLEDIADPASGGRRALVLCGNAGPILDGTLRNYVAERVLPTMVTNGIRIALNPTSAFAAKQLGLTLERDQLLSTPPGRGYVTSRGSAVLVRMLRPNH
jgi:DNA segregation ATPase FtsK/SpoIIIE, S-DNA-T family